ncbi:MAG: hypothetical protein OXL41_06060 [Nitrospinae bacterium]|nr:hypothetical protein [Nitrospinota bacterium]
MPSFDIASRAELQEAGSAINAARFVFWGLKCALSRKDAPIGP